MDEPVEIRIPEGYRCAIALTYDTDMAAGYSPDGICHGRTEPFLRDYILRLCDVAEGFDVRLHFFKIANGLEDERYWAHLRDVLARGHDVDSHTYSHCNLAYTPAEELAADLRRANRLLKDTLGVEPVVLRGPGGYAPGDLPPENRQVILANGFRYVSGQYDAAYLAGAPDHPIRESADHPPFRFPDGLIELPIQGYTDRGYFDGVHCTDPAALGAWRAEHGHRPVPPGWPCPWTPDGLLDDWIDYHRQCLDFAYEHRLLWIVCWHPYSHYLHDPHCRVLPAFIEYIRSKPEPISIGTLRDVVHHMIE